MSKTNCVFVILLLVAGAANAELLNDFSDISGLTTKTIWPCYAATLSQGSNELVVTFDYNSWGANWYFAGAGCSWALGEDYNFSGKNISFEAMNFGGTDAALVSLYNNGEQVGSSTWTRYQDWTVISWDCPVDTTYEVVDEIQIYVAADNFYRPDSGTNCIGKVRNFVSDAVPSPALLEGDANRDGVVSAGDYASVQSNFGNTGEPGILGDANIDGVVSAGDYASVQANFGNTISTSIAPVPEPASMILLAISGIGAFFRRKRK